MPRERRSIADHKLTSTRPQYTTTATEIPAGRPKYPKGISGEAKSAFKRLVHLLEERRSCTSGDFEICRLYAFLYDRHQRALAKLAAEGEVIMVTRFNKNGDECQTQKPNDWLKIAETCEAKMLACLTALGLTPLARGKVQPAAQPKPAPDPNEAATLSRDAEQPRVEDEIDLNSIDETVVN
jgi:P27 family predicted phage terminase small subunit